jgi:hypothetical protein
LHRYVLFKAIFIPRILDKFSSKHYNQRLMALQSLKNEIVVKLDQFLSVNYGWNWFIKSAQLLIISSAGPAVINKMEPIVLDKELILRNSILAEKFSDKF